MKKVIQFLKENFVTVMATSLNDKPRASAMEYIMVGDSMILSTDAQSIKAKNLKGNNRLSLSVHNMPKFVTIDGTVTEPTEAEVAEYGKLLLERHPEFKEMIEKGMMPPFKYFKISIDTAYFNDYSAGMSPTEIIKAN